MVIQVDNSDCAADERELLCGMSVHRSVPTTRFLYFASSELGEWAMSNQQFQDEELTDGRSDGQLSLWALCELMAMCKRNVVAGDQARLARINPAPMTRAIRTLHRRGVSFSGLGRIQSTRIKEKS